MNKKLINSMKQIAARNRELNVQLAADNFTPEMYAAVAIAMHRMGIDNSMINKVFVESQHIWCEEFGGCENQMLDLCHELTGIELRKVDRGYQE